MLSLLLVQFLFCFWKQKLCYSPVFYQYLFYFSISFIGKSKIKDYFVLLRKKIIVLYTWLYAQILIDNIICNFYCVRFYLYNVSYSDNNIIIKDYKIKNNKIYFIYFHISLLRKLIQTINKRGLFIILL